jgi:hypothetical protein
MCSEELLIAKLDLFFSVERVKRVPRTPKSGIISPFLFAKAFKRSLLSRLGVIEKVVVDSLMFRDANSQLYENSSVADSV